jgi:hypothetical protein
MKKTAILLACLLATACGHLDNARRVTDVATAVAVEANNEAIYQAEVERQRLRSFRCLNPMLTPNALAVAAEDPRLGDRWIDELLWDCPQVSGFISSLALRKLTEAGLTPMPPAK